MSGKLMATLFIPYLVIAILGSIADNTYSTTSTDNNKLLINQMYNVQTDNIKAVGTGAYTGNTDRENIFKAGFTFLKDSSSTMFGFAKVLFKILTLNYTWWSECRKSVDSSFSLISGYDDAAGWNLDGSQRTKGTNQCYINQDLIVEKDAPMPFVMVRYLLLIMGLPAIFILMFKSSELFARFLNAAGSTFGALTSFIRGF